MVPPANVCLTLPCALVCTVVLCVLGFLSLLHLPSLTPIESCSTRAVVTDVKFNDDKVSQDKTQTKVIQLVYVFEGVLFEGRKHTSRPGYPLVLKLHTLICYTQQ